MARRDTFIPFRHLGRGQYETHDHRFSIVKVDGEGWTLAFGKDHGGETIVSNLASQDDARKILESREDRPENEREKLAREKKERASGSNVKASNTRTTKLLTAEEYMQQRETSSRTSEQAAKQRNAKKS